jgi:hypothetical protein
MHDQRDPPKAWTGATRLALWSIAVTALSVAMLLLKGRPFPYPANVFVFLGGLVVAAVLALEARRPARAAARARLLSTTALVVIIVVALVFLGLIALLWVALRNFQ